MGDRKNKLLVIGGLMIGIKQFTDVDTMNARPIFIFPNRSGSFKKALVIFIYI